MEEYREKFKKISTILETLIQLYQIGYLDRMALTSSIITLIGNSNLSSKICEQIYRSIHYDEIGVKLDAFRQYFEKLIPVAYISFKLNGATYYADHSIVLCMIIIQSLFQIFTKNGHINVKTFNETNNETNSKRIILNSGNLTYDFEIPTEVFLMFSGGSITIFGEEFFAFLQNIDWDGPYFVLTNEKILTLSDESGISKTVNIENYGKILSLLCPYFKDSEIFSLDKSCFLIFTENF